MPNAPQPQSTATPGIVIGVEIPGFAKRSVPEQLQLRNELHQRLSASLRAIPPKDRIVLDTGVGAAVVVFGPPSLGLRVACALCGTRSAEAGSAALRTGLAIGPVEPVTGPNGETHITGDALDIAEHIASLIPSERLITTRAYADALRRELPECAPAIRSVDPLTDTQLRPHDLYAVQITHPAILALRRKTSGQSKPLVKWLTLQRAALAGLAAALSLFVWSSLVGLGHHTPPVSAPVVAASSPPIEIVPAKAPEQPERPAETTPEHAQLGNQHPSEPAQHAESHAPVEAVKPHNPARLRKAMTVAPVPRTGPSGVQVTESSIESRDVLAENRGENGKLQLAIAPWGEVLIDGKSVGISPPLTEMDLPAGSHYVEVRNGTSPPVLRRIEVASNETLKIRHRFADSR